MAPSTVPHSHTRHSATPSSTQPHSRHWVTCSAELAQHVRFHLHLGRPHRDQLQSATFSSTTLPLTLSLRHTIFRPPQGNNDNNKRSALFLRPDCLLPTCRSSPPSSSRAEQQKNSSSQRSLSRRATDVFFTLQSPLHSLQSMVIAVVVCVCFFGGMKSEDMSTSNTDRPIFFSSAG